MVFLFLLGLTLLTISAFTIGLTVGLAVTGFFICFVALGLAAAAGAELNEEADND